MPTPNSNLPFDPTNEPQRMAYNLIANTNASFFLTGRAGTGKTTFLRKIRQTINKNFVLVAPTGIAAIVAGGETIHSFFGMPLEILTEDTRYNINETKQRILREVDTIIVDEASMVRCDMVDAMDRILRIIMHNNLPFGGKQLVFSGDVFQLDPVVRRNSPEMDMLVDLYNTDMPYFYKANVFRRTKLLSVEFQKVYRQEDQEFLRILTNIRNGVVSWPDINRLNQRVSIMPPKGQLAITLTSINKTADEINQRHLDAIQSEAVVYEGQITGEYKPSELPVAQYLTLKKGAQVMMCRNDQARRWVNGTLATIVELQDNSVVVDIDGENYEVQTVEWEQTKHIYDKDSKKLTKEVVGTYAQLPLRLAWAITIHKSQGMTFERMILDLSRGVFVAGQLYVALSRVKSIDGLYLTTPIQSNYVLPKQQAIDFARDFNNTSAITNRIQVGEIIYPYLRKSDYDGAVRAYYELMQAAAARRDMPMAQQMANELLDLLIDDHCLSYDELRYIAEIVGRDVESMNSHYLRSVLLYRAERFQEADEANVQMYRSYGNVLDSKCFCILAQTNDVLGDPALQLYQKVLVDNIYYLPAYVALRAYLRKRNQYLDADQGSELADVYEDWNSRTFTDKEWQQKYAEKLSEKPLQKLRTSLFKLSFETLG